MSTAPSRIFPEWKVDSEFITEHLNDALRLDAQLSSHPIEVDCPDAGMITQVCGHLLFEHLKRERAVR